MLRGYRLILVAAGGLALLIALFLGAYFGSLYSPDHKQYQAVTRNQRGNGDYQGPSQSLPDISGLPSPIERAIANPSPATGVNHEKRDLAAQEASALWAFYMVVASFASVLITAVGTAFLYKQIVLTREAVEDTGDATAQMVRQTKIAEAAQRPYIHVESMEWFKPEYGRHWIFLLKIKNFGQTPATAFSISADVKFSIENIPPTVWRLRKCDASDLIPQSKITAIIVKSSDTRVNELGEAQNCHTEDIYCRFTLKYTDSFGNEYGLFETHCQRRDETGIGGDYRFFSTP